MYYDTVGLVAHTRHGTYEGRNVDPTMYYDTVGLVAHTSHAPTSDRTGIQLSTIIQLDLSNILVTAPHE